MFKKTLGFVIVGCLLAPAAIFGQSASDIRVPSGFRVEKVLESNKIGDPQGIAVLPSGDILVATLMWEIDKITPTGQVSTFARMKNDCGPQPYDIVATPAGTVFFTCNDLLGVRVEIRVFIAWTTARSFGSRLRGGNSLI